MPNKFTAKLDAMIPLDTDLILNQTLGEVGEEIRELNQTGLYFSSLCQLDNFREIQVLFFCLIAELSDQDLEECFPEIFPSAQSQSKEL